MEAIRMTERTDLTLNREFSRGEVRLRGLPLDREIIARARQAMAREKHDLTSHSKLNLFETYFGKGMPHNYWRNYEQWITTEVTPFYGTDYCYRCGKRVRIPWDRENLELCNDCAHALVEEYLKVPWNLPLKSSRRDERGEEELFNTL